MAINEQRKYTGPKDISAFVKYMDGRKQMENDPSYIHLKKRMEEAARRSREQSASRVKPQVQTSTQTTTAPIRNEQSIDSETIQYDPYLPEETVREGLEARKKRLAFDEIQQEYADFDRAYTENLKKSGTTITMKSLVSRAISRGITSEEVQNVPSQTQERDR